MQARSGPRIYNLFPLLIGPIEGWREHLGRIAAMRFNWIYLNPFHYPGFSGSLYAIKDPYRFNELFVAGGDGEAKLRQFLGEAAAQGLQVMMDLVVNHTARDAVLVAEHPDWYRRQPNGDLLSPGARDPAGGTMTVWGDLAELDYGHEAARRGLIEYWQGYIRHYVGLGIAGFRCDAAYKVAPEVWQPLIAAGRESEPGLVFFAETLGASLEEIEALSGAGFDYIFNSSKWWDFRADWLLDQYERFRRLAPSIAFPESHDTARVAAESGAEDSLRLAEEARFRYLFAACFSSGVMMPVGYEYGFKKRLDVVETRPGDWEAPALDISDFIAAANRIKAETPVLNEEGPQRRLTAPHEPVLALLRESVGRRGDCVLLIANPDRERAHEIDPGRLLAAAGGEIVAAHDVTPLASPAALVPGERLSLEPFEIRIFRCARPVPARRPAGAAADLAPEAAMRRVAIEEVWPEIDGGRFPVKRVIGDVLEVWADIFCDGHEQIAACVKYRPAKAADWQEVPLAFYDNDRWVGRVPLQSLGRTLYTIEAWRDLFATWRGDVAKKRAVGQDLELELTEGRALVEAAVAEAPERDTRTLHAALQRLDAAKDAASKADLLLSESLFEAMRRAGPRGETTRYERILEVVVDRLAARTGAWYELFPRSMSGDPKRHGSFADVAKRLPYVRDLGFDVLYFPPIHPIGRTNRKGRNNSLKAGPADPGSAYAIGSSEGGHTALHPELGSFDEFRELVAAARREGLEIALDFAIQCSPDHPWIAEHREWFDWRPDGSIRFAENPPKRYEDIVNVKFYGEAFPGAWRALRDVVLFWVGEGVRIFRVDNPHTKPLPFWEWLIRTVQDQDPGVIFLSEAFTRPKMMRRLAKVGFTQSYTYFTWRNTKAELTDYLTELTRSVAKEYFRPNFFVNTPDINPPFLQTGGRAAFQIRAALAATLSSLWGMYSGFELCEATPIPGREEYLDSEKYEIKAWDWDRPGNIRDFIARLNRIRRDNPALHELPNLAFHPAHHDQILFYGKMTAERDNILWIAVNLDPKTTHEAAIELPFHELGLGEEGAIEVEDLLQGGRFRWQGRSQRVRLDPAVNPCAIWRVVPPQAGARRV